MKNRGRIVIILLLALAVVAGFSAFWAPRYLEAAWLVEDIAAGPGPHAEKTMWQVVHKDPVIRAAAWTIDGRAGEGDLYLPDEPIKGRLVLVPGLFADARKDPRVIAFATSLARAGFATLTPQTAAFDGLKASPDDIVAVADAVAWLHGQTWPGAPETKVGIAALSYMSGPALLAAARAPTSEQVGFVFFIGPYYSMTDVVRFVTTRKFRLNDADPWSEAGEADYALWAFLKANAQGVDDAGDRATLEAIAGRKLLDPNADVSALAGQLKADGRPVWALISNRDPERVDALIAALPARLKAGLEALDLSAQDLSGFKGEAILIHGKDDPLIPSVESEKLAKALGARAHLYLLGQVTHVEVNRDSSLQDQLDMVFAGRRLLSLRE